MNNFKCIWLVFFILFAGCSNEKLPKYTVIQGLRVLALELDAPEINFDGTSFTPSTVNVTPVVSDLYGSGRVLQYNLEWCLDLGVSLGAIPTCVGNPSRNIIKAAQSVVTTATFLTPNFTGSLNADGVDLTAASASSLALIQHKFLNASATQLFNGMNLLVVYEVYPNGKQEQKVSTFKRIVFSSSAKALKNTNPAGLEIRKDSVEILNLPAGESSMEAYLPSNQAENYTQLNSDGTTFSKTETLETTWFLTGPEDISCSKKKECTTDGLFAMSRTRLGEYNTFYIPQVNVPTSRGRVLIGVARDDRGGVTTKRYCSGICP